MSGPVNIARCPVHGLHGARDRCFVCHGPVEQAPMVEVALCPRSAEEIARWALARARSAGPEPTPAVWRERALAAEAEARALREAQGELLELVS